MRCLISNSFHLRTARVRSLFLTSILWRLHLPSLDQYSDYAGASIVLGVLLDQSCLALQEAVLPP